MMPTDVNDHWPEMVVRIEGLDHLTATVAWTGGFLAALLLAMLLVFVLMLRRR